MTKYKNILGADQLVKGLTLPLEEIELNIQELENHKSELETLLNAGGKKFSLDSLKLNKETQGDLELVKRALKEAYGERERIIKANQSKTFKEAGDIIRTHLGKVRTEKAGENVRMIEKIHEIREIYKGLEQAEKEIAAELNEFLEEIEEFVSEDLLPSLRGYTDTYSSVGRLKFYDVFNEYAYGIKGLIKKDFEPQYYEIESDLQYGVVRPTPVEA